MINVIRNSDNSKQKLKQQIYLQEKQLSFDFYLSIFCYGQLVVRLSACF